MINLFEFATATRIVFGAGKLVEAPDAIEAFRKRVLLKRPFHDPPTLAPACGGGKVAAMKTTLITLLALGVCLPLAGAERPESEERPAMIVEKAIRKQLKKPKGELAKADLEKVVSLNLNFTKLTDEGLKELPKLKQLTYLRLFSTQITDASLKELAKRQQLTAIDLGLTQITDAGLKELAKMKQLTSLNLNNTKVTKAGVAELRKALPKCKIIHNAKK